MKLTPPRVVLKQDSQNPTGAAVISRTFFTRGENQHQPWRSGLVSDYGVYLHYYE
jgi:hypothetical protein